MATKEVVDPKAIGSITFTTAQLKLIIDCCKDVQRRIPVNGMPGMDVPFANMIVSLDQAYYASGGT